jgi:xanthine dehydrogenase accessory factor
MREVVRQLIAALDAGRPVAYCRLVETRGSTPQKAGAMMLVYADGSQAGTLGGGCVEAEVKRRAIALLEEGKSEVCTFQLDSDYGWDDGLICGGRMQILVEPITPQGQARGYFRKLAELVDGGEGITEAVVFDAQASALGAPTSYLFDAAGRFVAGLHVAGTTAGIDHRPNPFARLPAETVCIAGHRLPADPLALPTGDRGGRTCRQGGRRSGGRSGV